MAKLFEITDNLTKEELFQFLNQNNFLVKDLLDYLTTLDLGGLNETFTVLRDAHNDRLLIEELITKKTLEENLINDSLKKN
ncbi:MAG: hypothetical protein IPH62_15130 [Ignavibacteriae bacterium]|nr:hypothetical protein [Ignavibacteriota bacterium]